jgi:hypothetical protein
MYMWETRIGTNKRTNGHEFLTNRHELKNMKERKILYKELSYKKLLELFMRFIIL